MQPTDSIVSACRGTGRDRGRRHRRKPHSTPSPCTASSKTPQAYARTATCWRARSTMANGRAD